MSTRPVLLLISKCQSLWRLSSEIFCRCFWNSGPSLLSFLRHKKKLWRGKYFISFKTETESSGESIFPPFEELPLRVAVLLDQSWSLRTLDLIQHLNCRNITKLLEYCPMYLLISFLSSDAKRIDSNLSNNVTHCWLCVFVSAGVYLGAEQDVCLIVSNKS